ncbi:uncharacterized protein LOC128673582 [Plodia interpunctella]|uniref:uncharacterized protein LOC128673582 n=1 Tax=Plodia interpunctella TaxID=58824 RepID=UPI002368A4E3|nr:uncharacterized protein LOC128673582 [Plodia interpunctella]
MAKRRVYTGCYTHGSEPITALSKRKIKYFVRFSKEKYDLIYNFVMDYYFLLGTLFFVLVMSFVFPDFVHKINTSKDIMSLKKMVNFMSREVSRAEVACLTVADDLCYLQCTMQDGFTGTTEKQVRDLSVCTSFVQTKSEPARIVRNFGFLRRIFFPKKSNNSQQEITLMSYVYTNSLDALQPNATL